LLQTAFPGLVDFDFRRSDRNKLFASFIDSVLRSATPSSEQSTVSWETAQEAFFSGLQSFLTARKRAFTGCGTKTSGTRPAKGVEEQFPWRAGRRHRVAPAVDPVNYGRRIRGAPASPYITRAHTPSAPRVFISTASQAPPPGSKSFFRWGPSTLPPTP